MKKILLIIGLFVSFLTGKAQTATPPAGSGTEGDPYQVATLDNLYWISQNTSSWSAYFIQTADIDASTTNTWNVGDHDGDGGAVTAEEPMGFVPIGNFDDRFSGNYDGQGHIIDALYINRPTENFISLFGCINDLATISNLGVSNVDITAKEFVGGLVGIMYFGNAQIIECFSTGNVTGVQYVGGLSGSGYSASIYNSYSWVNASGSKSGGLNGDGSGLLIQNCYSIGYADNSGLNADIDIDEVYNSFWDTETSTKTFSYGGTGKTTAEMHDIKTYTDVSTVGLDDAWDFIDNFNDDTASEDIWAFGGTLGYPLLSWQDSLFAIVTEGSISNISTTSATGNANIVFLGSSNPTAHGYCWNTTGNPTISDNTSDEGSLSSTGTFSTSMTGLTNGETYFARAYVTNEFGTLYGNEIEFIAGYALVILDSISNLTDNSAIGYANITSLGISNATAHGFCWNTSGTPTLSDDFSDEGSNSSEGTFSSSISSLISGGEYYVRAYVTNSEGTSYSEEVIVTITVEPSGSGTEIDPYQIASLGNLRWLSENEEEWDKYYIQTNDIDATITSGWDEGNGFIPIGNNLNTFTGSYDGNGYVIDALYINRPTENYVGLFGFTKDVIIENLGLTNVDITGKGYSGSLIGYNIWGGSAIDKAFVDNCYSTGSITGNSTYVGGFAGQFLQGTITNCYSDVSVNSSGNYDGGFVGSCSYGVIENSYSTGDVTAANRSYVGGFIGKNYYTTITNSYATGNVTGGFYTGGFIGFNDHGNSSIVNCYSNGSVTSNSNNIGGFVGYHFNGTIANCYSTGLIIYGGSNSNIGGFIGFKNIGTVSGSFWDTQTSGYATSGGSEVGKTTAEMKEPCLYIDAGWDFSLENANGTDDFWGLNASENSGYPFLSIQGYTHNYGCSPTIQASNINITNGTYTADISWTNGNGDGRVVFIKETDTGVPSISDKTTYTASTNFGSGTEAGSGWYCVYNGTGTSVTVSNLTPGSTNRVMVLEYKNGAGSERYADYSATLNPNNFTQIKLDQTITFNALSDVTYGVGYFIPGATASSGLTVSYSSSDANVATIVAGFIKVVGVGTCTIYADQAGNSMYNAASQKSQSLTVNKKDLTISGVEVTSKTYDATTDATLNNGSASLVGIINDDEVTIDANAVTASFADKNVGTGKSVTASGYALSGPDVGNYTVSQPTGLTGIITQAELTISGIVNVTSKTYDGNTNATLTGGSLSGIIMSDVVSIDTRVGSFIDKNAGSNKSVNTALTITGTDAGNYSLTQPSGITGNILTKELTVSGAVVNSKTYDATTTATITGTLNGIIVFDDVSLVGQGAFASTNVGTGISVTSSSSLNGADAGNYILTQPTGLTGNITPKELKIGGSFTANNKNYDSFVEATEATNSLSLTDVESGDDVSLTNETYEFADVNVNTGIMVSITSADLTGTDAGNYTLSLTGAPTTTANILARELTISGSFTVGNKIYNADVNSSIASSSLSLTNIVSGDVVNLTNEVAEFADKNVGSGKIVSITGAELTGTDAGNYMLSLIGAPTTTADIEAKNLVLTGVTVDNKIYDGTTAGIFSGTAILTGIESGDDVNIDESSVSVIFADANVGTDISVTVSGFALTGIDATNYNIIQPSGLSADITAKELTIGGSFTVFDKNYDSFIEATEATNTLTLVGVETGDVVTLISETYEFADASVETDKMVSLVSADITGTDVGNYTLSLIGAPTATANISARELIINGTFTAENKTYNADVDATIATNNLSLANIISGDGVSLANEIIEFTDKNVGTGKTVSIAAADLVGTEAGNYIISFTGAPTATADITVKNLVIIGMIADNKEYDGTTLATLSGTASLDNVENGDDVSVDESSVSATFVDVNTGTGIAVNVSGFAITGVDASNYNLEALTDLTADITPMTVNVTVDTDQKKVYGEEEPILTYTANDLLNSDTYSGALSREIGEDVGTYAILQGTLTVNSNYEINFVSNDFEISPMLVTVTADADQTKVFGEIDPEFTYSATSLLNSDTYTGELSRVSGDDAGIYAITQGTLYAGSNYAIDFISNNFTITKADQVITVTNIPEQDIAITTTVFVEAIVNSGLDLSYTVLSGPATIVDSILTLNGETGTVVVEVSQAGNNNYNATSAATSFNVIDNSKEDQTITFATIADKIYGDATFGLAATASSDLEVSYTVVSGPVSISGSTVTITGVGNVIIEATQAGSETFNPAPAVQQTFSIAKAMLRVTAKDTARIVGEVNPDFELLYDGFVYGEDESVLTTLPVVSTDANETSSVGTYVIIVSGGESDTYDFEYVNGILTIEDGTGISATDQFNIEIFPNPVIDMLHIQHVQSYEMDISIFNLDGELILNQKAYGSINLNLNQYKSGLYIVRINNKSFRIIKN